MMSNFRPIFFSNTKKARVANKRDFTLKYGSRHPKVSTGLEIMIFLHLLRLGYCALVGLVYVGCSSDDGGVVVQSKAGFHL